MVAAVTDKVIVELDARLGRYNSDVNAARANFDRSVGGMASSAENAERRIQRSSGAIKGALLAATSALAAAASAQAISGLADGYTRFTNQLKLAGLEGANLASTQDALFASAQQYGVELESLGVLYGRVSQAGKELGASNEDLLKFTNGVAAAIKVQGGSAASAQGALLQLSQALGGTIVRAEEYNSINEGARPILQAVANGSDRFKGSVAALGLAVKDGTVTSREFYEAFLKGSEGLEGQATRANLTISASLTVLNNALGKYIGETDASLSATERFAAGIAGLAENLDTIIPAIGVLITLVGARYLGVAIANTAATMSNANAHAFRTAMIRAEALAEAQMTPFTNASTAAMLRQNAAIAANATRFTGAAGAIRGFGSGLLALAGGPIGLAVIAVAALSAGIYFLIRSQSDAEIAARAQAKATADAAPATSALDKLVRQLATANDVETVSIRKKIAALIDEQRIKAQMARNAYLAAKDEVRSREVVREQIRANPIFSAGGIPAGGLDFSRRRAPVPGGGLGPNGNPVDTVPDTPELRRLRAEAEAAEAAVARLRETADEATRPTPTAPSGAPAAAGPKAPAGRSAEDIAEERRRIEQRFADDIRDANRRLLDAREAMAVTEGQLLAGQIRRIRQDRDDAITEAERLGPNGTAELTQARVDQLTGLARATALIEEANAIQASQNTLARNELQAADARNGTARNYLELQRDLARSSAERAEMERLLLDLQFQQERAQLEGLLASQDASDVERQIAAERLAFLPQLQAAQREALRRASLTPLERLGTAETGPDARGPQQRREIVEGAVAGELDGLGAALASATMNLEGFGQTLLDAGAGIIEGVLAEVYQSIIVAPLADALSSGLDALFGTAATNVKTSADASAAVAATALATGATASATALAATAIAAEVLRNALLAAAAASAGDGVGDVLGSIGSAIAGSGGARAGGGRVLPGLRYSINDTTRNETFIPDVPGQIVPDLRLPQEAQNRQQGVNVSLVNNTGVPAVPVVERDDQGNSKITLEPIGNQMIEGAGRSGKLKRALQKSPAPKRRA